MNKYNIQHCSRKSKYEVSLHGLFWEMLIVHFVHLYRSAAWVSTVYEDIKSVLLYLAVPDSVSVLVEWGLKHCFCIIAHCDQRGFSICKFLNRKSCPTHFTRLMKFPSFRNQRLTNFFFSFGKWYNLYKNVYTMAVKNRKISLVDTASGYFSSAGRNSEWAREEMGCKKDQDWQAK